MVQEKLLISNRELAKLTAWSSFELVFDDIIDLLVEQTKQTEIKTRWIFYFRSKKWWILLACYFCQGITLEKIKETTGILIQTLFATPSGKPWAESFWWNKIHSPCSWQQFLGERQPNDKDEGTLWSTQHKSCAVWYCAWVTQCWWINGTLFWAPFMQTFHQSQTDLLWIQILGSCQLNRYAISSSYLWEKAYWIEKTEATFGSRVAKRALAVCNNPQDHSVFLDNFFSSYKSLMQLGKMGFWATETLQNDRIENCPLVLTNDMKK